MKIAVIGGGASGAFCAVKLAQGGADVTIFEKNEKIGKKLYITGKGRCNLTNDCDEKEFMSAVLRNPRFMYSSIYGFNSSSTMSFFEQLGLSLKVERGNRVFPLSDKSSDVIKALTNALKDNRVDVTLRSNVERVEKTDDVFRLRVDGKYFEFDKVVVATGGITYEQTGSTGDGYRFAREFSHNIIKPKGVLLGLISKEKFDLAGLALKNVSLTVKKQNKEIFNDFGELLFTHNGISGPLALTASSAVARENFNQLKFYIDLKPALDNETLNNRILRDFEKHVNKQFKFALSELLPSRLIAEVIKKTGIDENKRVNVITKEERLKLISVLKGFELTITSTNDDNEGIITCGGVDVKEISPKTMESKLVEGLYFIGEVIDVDAKTGGFNLQIAFSTANSCANSICETIY